MVAARPPGKGYRLPTEAEWEYAARMAGRETAAKYAWAGTYPPSGAAGNYGDRSAAAMLNNTLSTYDDRHAVTAPVGSFPANPAGIHDIGGNVAEWCHYFYDAYLGQVALSKNPLGPEEGRHHVVRGAGWRDSTISELRLSFRDYSDKPRADLGFRIARYAE
jgi:formylglycine-generating enzyme required for sulfatase activity